MARILDAIGRGEEQTARDLLPLVYDELLRLARLKRAALDLDGLVADDAAEALGVVRRTAARDWAFARARLIGQLAPRDPP